MTKRQPLTLILFASLFFVSGAAGLIYEIVWERLLGLYFGVSMVSVTLIVAAYMAGLGIGSLAGGRLARQTRNTLLTYGLLELGIALFGIFSPLLIIGIGQRMAGSAYALVFLISFGVLLLPTTMMGMTLPLLAQSFVHRVESSGRIIGILYGINTLGAALGALLAAYGLIGEFGFDGTTYIAVAMNAFVGLCALLLAHRGTARATVESGTLTIPPGLKVHWGYKTILVSSFLVGFIGLGFEMLWIRILYIVNKNTAYSFPSILFVFLLGLALGGYFFGRRADSADNPILLFCRLEISAATIATFTLVAFWLLLDYIPPGVQDFFETQKPALPFVKVHQELLFSRRLLLATLWEYFLPILLLVLPASFLFGGGLPVLDRIAINNPALAGRRVGDIHLANILGSVVGTLAISFVFLPSVGSEWTLKLLALLTLTFPILYLIQFTGKVPTWRQSPALFVTAALLLLGISISPGRGVFYQDLYAKSMRSEAVISESGDSVLALTYEPGSNQRNGLFWIGGEVNSFFPPKGVYENRALACAGASVPEDILVIGFGGGYSALFYKSLPDVEHIVIVELLGDVAHFLTENRESARVTLSDPRLTYLVDDGRRYLNKFPEESFDLIAIDPLRQHTAGHNNLYSQEAMRLYLRHLNPGGVLCAWTDEDHIIPHTTARVFPYVDQFQNQLLIAGQRPITYDRDYMDRATESYRSLIESIYPEGIEGYPATEIALGGLARDQDQILAAEAGVEYLTDLKPWLEYYLLRKPIK